MEKETIRNIVKQAFEKCYDKDYKLVEMNETESTIEYSIVAKINGIIVNFKVIGNGAGIFNASSPNGLLTCRFEVMDWFNFLETVDNELMKEAYKNE